MLFTVLHVMYLTITLKLAFQLRLDVSDISDDADEEERSCSSNASKRSNEDWVSGIPRHYAVK